MARSGRTDAEGETPILWPPDAEVTHWKRPWCWERLGARGEGGGRGWGGRMASPTWWIRVWVSSGSWWWTGRPGVLQPVGAQSRTRLSEWAGPKSWARGLALRVRLSRCLLRPGLPRAACPTELRLKSWGITTTSWLCLSGHPREEGTQRVCCCGCGADQERRDASAVSTAPWVLFQPLSLRLAYHGFNQQCASEIQRNSCCCELDRQDSPPGVHRVP